MLNRFLLFIAAFLIGNSLFGQLYPKRHYRTQDGLVQKQVTCLFEDASGSMWIGTKGGVTRFDGNNMKSLTVQDGLESNHVVAFTENIGRGILAFSHTGISNIQRNKATILLTGQFYQLIDAANDVSGFSYFLVNQEYPELWLCDTAYHIREIAFEDTFGTIPVQLWKNPANSFIFLRDSGGNYFLLEKGNITSLDSLDLFPYLNNPIRPDEKLQNTYSRLFRNSQEYKFLPFDSNSIQQVFQPAAGWFCLSGDAKEELSVQTESGIERLDYPFNYINVLLVDRRMQVWVGTENGVIVFHHLLFRNYINSQFLTDPWAIVEGEGDCIYVGNYGSGLAEIRDQRISKPAITFALPDTRDNQHAQKHFYHGGVPGFSNELHFNTSRGVLTLDKQVIRRVVPLPNSPVYSSMFDSVNQRILFSSYQHGIYSWSAGHILTKLVRCTHPALERIYSMVYGPSGELFFGSEHEVAIATPDSFRLFRDLAGDSLRGAYTMVRDTKGTVWFGNDFGLFSFDGKYIHRVNHHFLNQTVRALLLLNKNQLLIGSSEGIGVLFLDSFVNEEEPKIKWYDYRNGYEGGEVAINGLYRARNGKVWIAGAQGVIRMDPDYIRLDTIPVQSEINEVQVGGYKSGWTPVLPDSNGVYVLDHDQNQIRIAYNSINLKSPQRDYYQHRLIGHSDQWCTPTQESFAIFNNLSPGSYRFELRVRNKDDLWDPDPEAFVLNIIPAWYQTRIVKIVLTLLAIVAIIVSTNLITRRKQRLKIQRVMKENEMAILKLEAIRSRLEPHFIFNVLNSIGYAIRTRETEVAYEYLTKFSGLIRRWLKSSDEALLTLEAELGLVREYLDLEKFRFEEQLSYTIEVSDGVPIDMMIPRMILQIPVENAVKHGLSNLPQGGLLSIKIDPLGNGIRIQVSDNGIGREEAAKRATTGNSRGIKLLGKLLDNLRQYNDYIVDYQIIDLFDNDQCPAGTSVELSITFR